MISITKRHLIIIAIAAIAIVCSSCSGAGGISSDSNDPYGITAGSYLTEAGNPPTPQPTPPKALVMAFESVTIEYPGDGWEGKKSDDLEAVFTSADKTVTASVSPGYVPLETYVTQVFPELAFDPAAVEGFDAALTSTSPIPDTGDVLFILIANRLLESGVYVQLQMTGHLYSDTDFLNVFKVVHDRMKPIPFLVAAVDSQSWFQQIQDPPKPHPVAPLPHP